VRASELYEQTIPRPRPLVVGALSALGSDGGHGKGYGGQLIKESPHRH
jgi:hypothetical protein